MKRLAFLPAILLAAMALSAQTGDEWFWDKPVSAVQWEGTVNADRRELDSLAKPFIGQPFTESLWVDLQARVYELEWFDSIEPAAFPADEARSKVLIKFTVVERPSISAIRVAGNSGLRDQEVLDSIQEKAGDIYLPAKARIDELAVRRLYVEKGYPDASVVSSTQPAKGEGQVELVFTVDEGSQVAVKEIRFTGNTTFSSQTLKAKLSLKELGLFQGGVFQEAKLEEDRATLEEFYKGRGFADAAVFDVAREYGEDPKTGKSLLTLTFSLKEGRQWIYGGMSFEGNLIFPAEKLATLVYQRPDGILNYAKLLQDKQRVDDLYYENGYIFNDISLGESRDEEKGVISYVVRIVERDRAHIESIGFKGNEKTRDDVLAREIPLEVGDIFSKAKIVEGLRNLYNLQYFSAIEPEMRAGSAEGLMDLVVNVEEQSTADIQFGVTLSGFGQPGNFPVSGMLKWNDRNFLGNGQSFSIEANASPTDQTLSFGWSDAWLFGRRILGGVNLSMDHKRISTAMDMAGPIFEDGVPDPYGSWEEYSAAGLVVPSAYQMPYESLDFTLGLTGGYSFSLPIGSLGFGLGFATTLGTLSYDPAVYRPAAADIRERNKTWNLSNKLFARGFLNRLDLWYNPTKGYYGSQKLTLAGVLPGETQQYIRSDSRLEAYATLLDLRVVENWRLKLIFGAHSAFSAIMPKPFGTELAVNSEDYVRIDGTFVGRGWNSSYNAQGLALWDNWMELRIPLFESFLWLDGFLDAAALKTENGLLVFTGDTPQDLAGGSSTLGFGNMAFSTGFGFRFTIPQFPFRFYFARRFSFDGQVLDWKGTGLEFVISISQQLQ